MYPRLGAEDKSHRQQQLQHAPLQQQQHPGFMPPHRTHPQHPPAPRHPQPLMMGSPIANWQLPYQQHRHHPHPHPQQSGSQCQQLTPRMQVPHFSRMTDFPPVHLPQQNPGFQRHLGRQNYDVGMEKVAQIRSRYHREVQSPGNGGPQNTGVPNLLNMPFPHIVQQLQPAGRPLAQSASSGQTVQDTQWRQKLPLHHGMENILDHSASPMSITQQSAQAGCARQGDQRPRPQSQHQSFGLKQLLERPVNTAAKTKQNFEMFNLRPPKSNDALQSLTDLVTAHGQDQAYEKQVHPANTHLDKLWTPPFEARRPLSSHLYSPRSAPPGIAGKPRHFTGDLGQSPVPMQYRERRERSPDLFPSPVSEPDTEQLPQDSHRAASGAATYTGGHHSGSAWLPMSSLGTDTLLDMLEQESQKVRNSMSKQVLDLHRDDLSPDPQVQLLKSTLSSSLVGRPVAGSEVLPEFPLSPPEPEESAMEMAGENCLQDAGFAVSSAAGRVTLEAGGRVAPSSSAVASATSTAVSPEPQQEPNPSLTLTNATHTSFPLQGPSGVSPPLKKSKQDFLVKQDSSVSLNSSPAPEQASEFHNVHQANLNVTDVENASLVAMDTDSQQLSSAALHGVGTDPRLPLQEGELAMEYTSSEPLSLMVPTSVTAKESLKSAGAAFSETSLSEREYISEDFCATEDAGTTSCVEDHTAVSESSSDTVSHEKGSLPSPSSSRSHRQSPKKLWPDYYVDQSAMRKGGKSPIKTDKLKCELDSSVNSDSEVFKTGLPKSPTAQSQHRVSPRKVWNDFYVDKTALKKAKSPSRKSFFPKIKFVGGCRDLTGKDKKKRRRVRSINMGKKRKRSHRRNVSAENDMNELNRGSGYRTQLKDMFMGAPQPCYTLEDLLDLCTPCSIPVVDFMKELEFSS